MADFKTQLPAGDARTFGFQCQKDGVLQDLVGYTVTLTAVYTDPTGAKTTITAATTPGSSTTLVLVELTADKTTVPGYYDAIVTAAKVGSPGPWSAEGAIRITPRPA